MIAQYVFIVMEPDLSVKICWCFLTGIIQTNN